MQHNVKLVGIAPAAEINAPWIRLIRAILMITIIVIIFYVILIFLVMRVITSPLKQLTDASQRLADADYDVDLSYHGNNEIGTLTGSFKMMRDRIRNYIDDLNHQLYHDKLTDLPNMRHFFTLAQELRSNMLAQGLQPVMLYFDIVGLRHYNRQYGFEKGDRLIVGRPDFLGYGAADAFSVYVIVISTRVVTASGEGYLVSVTYTDAAHLPAGTYLTAEELLPGSEAYESACAAASATLEEVGPEAIRFFDLTLYDPDGTKVEPEGAVSVEIRLDKPLMEEEHDNWVLHLAGDEPELIEPERNESEAAFTKQGGETIAFTTGSFSTYAFYSVRNILNLIGNLDGKKALIVHNVRSIATDSYPNTGVATDALTNTPDPDTQGRLLACAGKIYKTSTKFYFDTTDAEASATLWTFTLVENYKYYVQDENGKYLSLNENGAFLSDDPVVLQFRQFTSDNYNNRLGLYQEDTNYRLHFNSANHNYDASTVNTGVAYTSHIVLLTDAEVSTQDAPVYTGTKYASYDMQGAQGAYEDGMQIDDIIIYHMVFNPTTQTYIPYVIDGEGNAVQAYDDGDNITFHSVVSPIWHMTICTRDGMSTGELNGYYIFQNVGTGLVLDPQHDSVVGQYVAYNKSGVLLAGREAHQANSTMEKWDSGENQDYGYKFVMEDGRVVLKPAAGSESIALSFAYVKPHHVQDELHEVQTVDSASHGITIRMFDYGGGTQKQADEATTEPNTNTWIDDYEGSTVYTGSGTPEKGRVTRTLGENGFPTFTKTNINAAGLFDPTSGSQFYQGEGNHLFLAAPYASTGYYSYSGFQNYAHYNDDGTFTVYEEIGTAGSAGAPTHERGHFLPYNTIAADRPALNGNTNQYDNRLAPLDFEDPNLGETLYQAGYGRPNLPATHGEPEPVNYFFGMTMDFTFMKTKGGLVNGEPLVYEFTGDDDLWIYVDGVLVLDLGGVHSASNGTINFATGVITGDGVTNADNTIKKCFQLAGVFPDGTPWDNTRVNEYFAGNTFKDYTRHTFKMLYMEHGAGASNLNMRFNLPIMEEAQFVVEKQLAGTVQGDYANVSFAYQAFYLDDENNEHPLVPGVTFDGHPEAVEVVFENGGATVPFYDSESINGQTYTNVFYLKPGQAAVFKNVPEDVKYYVQEVGIPDGFCDSVYINGEEVQDAGNGVYPSTVEAVGRRARVVFENHMVANKLLIHKQMTEGSVDDGSTFTFQILMENTAGQLTEYSRAPYYVKKNGTYYIFSGGTWMEYGPNRPVEPQYQYNTSRYGLVENIPIGFTVEIPGLVAGTSFYVNEVQVPVGWEFYSKTPVEDTYDPSTLPGQAWNYETNDYDSVTADGQIKPSTDAEVIFTNRYNTTDVTVVKDWQDNNNQDGKRPASVSVQLYSKTDSETAATPVGNAVTLNADNSWTYTWNGLARYRNGKIVSYSVVESPVPNEYSVSYAPASVNFNDDDRTITVTNSYTPETTKLKGDEQLHA